MFDKITYANSVVPDQTAPKRSSLIRVYTVCQSTKYFKKQLHKKKKISPKTWWNKVFERNIYSTYNICLFWRNKKNIRNFLVEKSILSGAKILAADCFWKLQAQLESKRKILHTAFSVFIAKNLCFPSPAPYTYPKALESVMSLDINEILWTRWVWLTAWNRRKLPYITIRVFRLQTGSDMPKQCTWIKLLL